MKMRHLGLSLLTLVFVTGSGQSQTLFNYEKKSYKANDLDPRYQQQIFDAEHTKHKMLQKAIDDAVLGIYFKEEAKKSGKTVQEVRDNKLKSAPPTDKELKDFYEKNRKKIPYPFDQIRGELIRFVSEQKKNDIRQNILTELKQSKKFISKISEPKPPKIDINIKGYPSQGSPSAKVVIVEFADYKCPHCKEAAEVFEKIVKKYKDKIHYVFIDFPVIGDSFKIAEGAFCAGKQNKYWEFHKKAFREQGKLKTPEEVASAIGLKSTQFKTCLDKREGREVVDQAREEGVRVGVSGTPTVFVNGYRLSNGYTEKDISTAIDKALSGRSS